MISKKNKNYCAPCAESKKNKEPKSKIKSCYSIESLQKIIKGWNKYYPNNKILIDNKKDKNKDYLWKLIQTKLSSACHNNEKCWKEQDFVKKMNDTEIKLYTFKPDYPKEWIKNKYAWLSTYDILYVMKQYEKLYNNFMFFGPVPADCPVSIHCELRKLDLEKLKKNKIDRVGIVYNLDMSHQSGSHWVAVYIDILNNEINYYDSGGNQPTPLIKKFIITLGNKILKKNNDVNIIYNDKKHQFGRTECGIYSMNFLLERLHGSSMYDISKMSIPDEKMNHLRKILYAY
jgi:hypothetical protein